MLWNCKFSRAEMLITLCDTDTWTFITCRKHNSYYHIIFYLCLVQTKKAAKEVSYRIVINNHQRKISYRVVLLYLN